MTALPTRDRENLTLICDECGRRLAGISSTLRNWDVVWALVSKHGWTGSPLAIGPHRCPDCAGGVPPAASERVPRPVWHASVRTVGAASVVELHGDLDVLVADRLREVLEQACAAHPNVVLDLTNVRLIDSTALGVLVRAHQTVKPKGGHVCLAAPSRFIIASLGTMRLLPIFPVFASNEQAADWIAAGFP